MVKIILVIPQSLKWHIDIIPKKANEFIGFFHDIKTLLEHVVDLL